MFVKHKMKITKTLYVDKKFVDIIIKMDESFNSIVNEAIKRYLIERGLLQDGIQEEGKKK